MDRLAVDLHGLETQEASIIAYQHMYDLINGKIDEIIFITGIGTGALKYTVENLCDKNNLNYQLLNNGGAYLVTRKSIIINFDDEENEADWEDIKNIFEEFK